MVKEIEKGGLPIVQMCNLIPVAKTVGSNRIVPTISIPYPLGDPATSKEEQWKLRYHRTKVALESLATDIKEKTEEQRVLYLSDTNRDHGGLVGCL